VPRGTAVVEIEKTALGGSRKPLCFSSMTAANQSAGAAMKLLIALFALAVLGTAAAGIGIAVQTGHLGHHDAGMRAIHYDTSYDLSASRRLPAE